MTRANATDRLRRLDLIAAQLKEDGFATVQALAQAHGVSPRTITRDLQIMRDQGLPIEADRGRGGGVRLDRRWGVGRMNLSYAEAVDLLISLAVAERMQSPLFLGNLGSIRRQLVASFAQEKRTRVEQVKSRVLVGMTSSPFVQGSVVQAPVVSGDGDPAGGPQTRTIQAIHQAFLNQTKLHISYRNEAGSQTDRMVEPHYLLLNYPVWYVLAVDHLRGGVRTFRTDRILSARRQEDRFTLRPKSDFTAFFQDLGLLGQGDDPGAI